MKTIKIIDLLNKIANEEEVPLEIKYYNKKYRYDSLSNDYEQIGGFNSLFKNLLILKHGFDLPKFLNYEVEILEEEKKIPEKLNLDKDELRGKETPRTIDYLIEGKINEVIDYLKSKGENNDI